MKAISCIRFDIIIVLFTPLNLGRYVESAIPGASLLSRGIPAKDGFTTTGFSAGYLDDSFDRPRIPRQVARDPHDAPSLPHKTEEKWVCDPGKEYCFYLTEKRKNWLDASESCSAEETKQFMELNKDTSWSSLYWNAGRWHKFDEDTYSPAYFDDRVVTVADLRQIAQGVQCFSIGAWDPDSRRILSVTSPGLECNVAIPFMCTTANAKFTETQRKLQLPLKQVIRIEIEKVPGPDPGTEVLRCVPKFKDAYDNLKDRPFNIVWILDGAYYPKEGIKHGDHSTTMTVPYKHFTKYACEVRYLGSFYGNRSQEIEVATPSRGKVGLLIRLRNVTFSTSSLQFNNPIEKLKDAINNERGDFTLSRVGSTLYEQNGAELFITEYLLRDTFQGRELTDMIKYEEQIESLNALLNGSSINEPVQKNTQAAIANLENYFSKSSLVGIQFFAADRCPLERTASYFWAGGIGEPVQSSLTGDQPTAICLDESKKPVNRTCMGSPGFGAQWVEPFSEEQNCSRASNNCRAEHSLATLEDGKERPLGNSWVETPYNRTTLSREGCVYENGSLVQRTCIGDVYRGAYWGPKQAWNAEGKLVNVSNNLTCASPSNTTSWLMNISATQLNATSALAELQRVTSQWDPIVADVHLAALVFSNASREETEFSQTDVEQTASIIQHVLNVDIGILASAQRLPNVSTNFLMGIEEILTNTNSNDSTLMSPALWGNTAKLESSPFVFTADSSNLGKSNDTVANISVISGTSHNLTDDHHHDVVVVLNGSSLMVNRIDASQIAFVYHANIRLADAAADAGKPYAKVYSPSAKGEDHGMLPTGNYTANSAMVQVAVGGGPVYNLSELVNIYFRPFRAVNTSNSTNTVVCAFWSSEVNNGSGGWSTQGCWYRGIENGLDHCQCNHLSSFASLFPYHDNNLTSDDWILDVLTTIGCALSLLGCTGVIATFAFFPKWRNPKPGYYGHHVIFHLSLALAMLLSTFLGGFRQNGNPNVCLFVAVFLHYLILVVFFWMLVEAYCHYSFFLRVLGSMSSDFMWKACLFAWVLPLVPVIALVVCKRDLYYYKDGNTHCSLKREGFYCALLPFAILMSLINLAVFIRIIAKVGCAKPKLRTTQRKRSFTHYTAIVMFFIMGLSWIFGLLAIGQARTFFSYLFCFFNSLQGFVIFLHFIFRGARAQEEWQNFVEGISDRIKARNSVPGQDTCVATSETSLSTSSWTSKSQIIGDLKNRPRQQNSPQYGTSNL